MIRPSLDPISIKDYLNRFTLVVGDLNSGKTTWTNHVLAAFSQFAEDTITVVDLAPEITPQDLKGRKDKAPVGGRLSIPPGRSVRYLCGNIYPPRLRAADDNEAEALAQKNRRTIDRLFEFALGQKPPVLFVNDCSLYLHAGSAARFLNWIRSSPTSIVNGYTGRAFKESRITRNEKKGMDFLIRHCDQLIRKGDPF